MPLNENEFLLQAVTRISSSLDLDIAALRCLEYIQQFMPAQQISVSLYESDLGLLRNIALASLGKKSTSLVRGFTIPLDKDARQFMDSVSLPHMRIINRPLSDPIGQLLAAIRGSDQFSAMIVYMDVEGKWIGTLSVGTDEGKDRYTKEHQHLFSLLKDPFVIATSNALRYLEISKLKDMLADENRYLSKELEQAGNVEVVGKDSGLKEVMALVKEVSFRDSPVLLLGETGVGKDIIAKAIHFSSPRHRGPFIKVNCGAIPESLLDSELFGYEKGAFTGALAKKIGRFERADGGTIFLDEIGELTANAQVRMLRVLQDREIERVGGTSSIPLNIRIIAATNRDLQQMTKENRFRLDLWFRLQVFPIMIPPLREHLEDIPALVEYFINAKSRELKIYPIPGLTRGAIDRLQAYNWPGNIRELENLVERELILSKGKPLAFEGLTGPRREEPPPIPIPGGSLRLDEVVASHIQQVLVLCQGQIAGPGGAAEILGVNSNTLRHRMEKLDITFGRKKS